MTWNKMGLEVISFTIKEVRDKERIHHQHGQPALGIKRDAGRCCRELIAKYRHQTGIGAAGVPVAKAQRIKTAY